MLVTEQASKKLLCTLAKRHFVVFFVPFTRLP